MQGVRYCNVTGLDGRCDEREFPSDEFEKSESSNEKNFTYPGRMPAV